MRRIATEEAFSLPEVVTALRDLCAGPGQGIDMMLVRKIYGGVEGYQGRFLAPLLDIEQERLRDMDANGVDMHLLSLTAPGVQMFDADTATELAALANDRLAEIMRAHPTRFAGLATFAPQSPKRAVKEMERAITKLKLNGFMINSHTNNEYLDDPKYWPILEAAEALDRCIYIHPRGAFRRAVGPDARLRHGLGDVGLWRRGRHARRADDGSGVFDRFPRLKIVHRPHGRGRAVLDVAHRLHERRAQGTVGRAPKTKPSEYFRRNFVITTSGVRITAGAGLFDRPARGRQRDVGDRLPLPADGAGGGIHGRRRAVRRRPAQALPPERRADLPHSVLKPAAAAIAPFRGLTIRNNASSQANPPYRISADRWSSGFCTRAVKRASSSGRVSDPGKVL